MIKKIIFSSPNWHLNGVNIFTSNLAKQLIKENYDVEILLTQKDLKSVYQEKNMPLDKTLPVKDFNVKTSKKHYWKNHWEALKEYLEKNSPCIYIPNYDFCHASICPILSDEVLTVGIVHSNDETHYEQTRRLGRFWNAIVTVSQDIHEKVKSFDQYNNDKLFNVNYGLNIPENSPAKSFAVKNCPIKLVYTGRLIEHQKRVSDLPRIMQLLDEKNINYEFHIAGNGPQEKSLRRQCRKFEKRGVCKFHGVLPNNRIMEILRDSDVFILTSEFEGKPLSLIEAMSYGCVPVVTRTESGIPELIDDGANGYSVPTGNIEKFVEKIMELYKNKEKFKKMSEMAYKKVNCSEYTVQKMADSYVEVFEFAEKRKTAGEFIRPKGDIYPPKFLMITPDILQTLSWKVTSPLRQIGKKLFKYEDL